MIESAQLPGAARIHFRGADHLEPFPFAYVNGKDFSTGTGLPSFSDYQIRVPLREHEFREHHV